MIKKIVLITGSTSGIGKQIALDFLKQGDFVIINSTKNEKNLKIELEFFKEYKDMFKYYMFDVTNRQEVKVAISDILSRYGRIDILVNNAGITKDRTLVNLEYNMWDEVIDTNLTGVFNICKEVVPYMREKKSGKIINISSVIGLSGNFGQCNYSASKAGLNGFSKSLSLELARYGITVNVVSPGFIYTEMTKCMPIKSIENIKKKIPMGHMGKTEDVSNVVMFLAKDESSYITGSNISVNGGLY